MPTGLGDEQLWLCPTINESANDLSGNGNHGTLSGMTFNNDAGGKHFYQGSSNSDKVTGNFSTPFDARSISFWTSSSSTNSSSFHLLDSSTVTTKLGDSRYLKRYGVVVDGSTGNHGSTFINQNVWHHVVCTYDPDSQVSAVYINGVLDGQTTGVTGSTTTDSYEVGAVLQWSRFDDIRAYDRVLTQAEITHLASERGVEGPPPVGLGTEKTWLCPSILDAATDLTGNKSFAYGGNLGTVSSTGYGGTRAYDLTSGAYIDQDSSEVMDDTDSFAVSWWLNHSDIGTNTDKYIIDTTTGGGNLPGYRLTIRNQNGQLRVNAYIRRDGNKGSTPILVGNNSDYQGVYTHYTVCWDNDSSTWILYINGQHTATASTIFTGFPSTTSTSARLFNYKHTTPPTFGAIAAELDDFRIHNRVLTQAEVTHLASQRGVEGPPPAGLGDEQLWLCPSLNDSANDISGNGNDGTYQGGMGTVADTNNGGTYAYDFDGTDDYISVLGGVGTGTTDAFCLSYWMNWEANGTEYMWDMDYPESNALSVYATTGPAKVQAITRPNSDGSGNTYNNVSTNTWVHVLFQREAGSNIIKTYIDGSLKPVTRTASDSITLSNDITLGNNIDGSSLYAYEGKMDDIRWFNKSLTQAEITHLATSRGIEGPPPVGLGDEVNWYCPSLNQNADITGTGGSLTLNGNSFVSDTGSGGETALHCQATSTMPSNTSLYSSVSDVSYSVWVKQISISSTQYYFYAGGGGTARNPWFNGRTTRSEVYIANAIALGTTLALNDWYHLAVVKSGTSLTYYVNGVEEQTVSCDALTPSATNLTWSWSIGSDDFYMDDTRGYDRALTQAEITHLAEARGIEGPPPVGLGDEKLWLCPSLNDSANDISGNGNNGTYQGGMGTVADTGNGGTYAYEFDGVNDYIDTSNVLGLGSGDFSISFWVKSSSSSQGTLLSTYNSTNGKWISTEFNGDVNGGTDVGKVRAGIDDNTTKMVTNTYTASYNDGTWRHFVVERNNADGKLRVRHGGSSVSSIVIGTYGDVTSTVPLRIGSNNTVSSGFFDGVMDDIRIYHRTLTQAEITHLAEARGIEGPPPVGLGDEKLWLCPSLNDSANDISGSGNNGSYGGSMSTVADTDNGGSMAYFADAWGDYVAVDQFGGPLSESRTVSYWVKRVGTGNFTEIGVTANYFFGGTNNRWLLQQGSNYAFWNSGTNNYTLSSPSKNAWEHVTIVRDNGSGDAEIYLDGTLADTWTPSNIYDASTDPSDFFVGMMPQSGTATIDLYMDDIRAYDRTLTQAEITHLASSRGIEGGPSQTPRYNPFLAKTFQNTTFNNRFIG